MLPQASDVGSIPIAPLQKLLWAELRTAEPALRILGGNRQFPDGHQ
jgi:hypothetical protein